MYPKNARPDEWAKCQWYFMFSNARRMRRNLWEEWLELVQTDHVETPIRYAAGEEYQGYGNRAKILNCICDVVCK